MEEAVFSGLTVLSGVGVSLEKVRLYMSIFDVWRSKVHLSVVQSSENAGALKKSRETAAFHTKIRVARRNKTRGFGDGDGG